MKQFASALLRFGFISTLVVVLLASAALTTQRITAQGGKTVTYDTPVDGQITDAAFEETWTLAAPAKDRVMITVTRTGGTLVPDIELRDANNQRITSAGNDESYAQATINPFDLPSAGTYNIAVGRYGTKDGKTNGSYKLTVALMGAADDNPNLKGTPSPIEYGKAVSGELTNAKWKNLWTFSAPAKDIVSITAQRVDGTVRPELDLLDGSGNSVTKAYMDRGGDSSTISHFRLPGPGQYTIAVQRDNQHNGGSVGKYSLTITLDGAGPDRPDLLKAQGPAKLDSSVSGELTNAKWVDVWSLDAPSKEHLLLRASRTEGNLMPVVMLFGANNQEISRANPDPTGAVAELDATLPGPGKYEIRVLRYEDDAGISTGKYELAVTVLGTGEDDATFKTSAGEVQVGTPVKGALTNAKWQDTWTVNIKDPGPVTIKVSRTSGTLVPVVRLRGANQQDITSANPDQSFASAVINQVTLPGPGQYTIEVSRYSDARGETTGAYELSVTVGEKK